MKKNPFIGTIVFGVFLVLAGILILSNQSIFVKIIVIIAGVYSLTTGFYTLFNIGAWQFSKNTKVLAIIKSVFSIILGIVAIVAPLTFAEVYMGTIQILIGIILCFEAVVAIENAIMCKKIDKKIDISSFAWEALIDVVLAFIFFMNPDKALPAVVTVIGVAGIVLGAVCLIWGIITAVKFKKLSDDIEKEL
ncbi:MAG: DUF308 domain-containing protein [Sphaerochaetaceae bacterium]|nr:DUF308 domain-containing protein [Sphaerochaetaceae bacterium]